ncbi:hypothetical protein [Mucilaginibacter gilvus]|uniref:hypothetical protein n=1 Tax=Mucilaginibacter gilvus TaxID=2305909 RepID=UPI000FFBF5C9|nr:hypothetical protein [Mucilaginibacter gilvus]
MSIISALLVVVPVLAEFALVPLAIANILKSYRHKEPFNKYRMFYLIVLIIILALLLIFILAIVGDVRSL